MMLVFAWSAFGIVLIVAGVVILIRANARDPETEVKESDVEAALEGALNRELSDFHFGGRA